MNRTSISRIAVFAFCVAAFVAIARNEASEEQINLDLYNDMTAIWCNDELRGIEPSKRAGWPPYNGACAK